MNAHRAALPWQIRDTSLRRSAMILGAIGCALSAPPLVHALLGGDLLPPGALSAVAVFASTLAWAALFIKWRRRWSFWHFLWMGPVLGALNAGTSLALLQLLQPGDGLSDIIPALLMGTLFGTVMGGGPLGLLLGGGLALYGRACDRALAGANPNALLSALFASATWLSGMTGLVFFAANMRPPTGHMQLLSWLCVGSAVLALASLLAHLWALGWIVRVGRRQVPGFVLKKDENDTPIIVWQSSPMEGPFRASEREQRVGPQPKTSRLVANAGLSLGLMLAAGLLFAPGG